MRGRLLAITGRLLAMRGRLSARYDPLMDSYNAVFQRTRETKKTNLTYYVFQSPEECNLCAFRIVISDVQITVL